MDKKVQLLDCTLRDGGNGLEALEKYYGDVVKFDRETMDDLIEALRKTNIDIVEIGNIQRGVLAFCLHSHHKKHKQSHAEYRNHQKSAQQKTEALISPVTVPLVKKTLIFNKNTPP